MLLISACGSDSLTRLGTDSLTVSAALTLSGNAIVFLHSALHSRVRADAGSGPRSSSCRRSCSYSSTSETQTQPARSSPANSRLVVHNATPDLQYEVGRRWHPAELIFLAQRNAGKWDRVTNWWWVSTASNRSGQKRSGGCARKLGFCDTGHEVPRAWTAAGQLAQVQRDFEVTS